MLAIDSLLIILAMGLSILTRPLFVPLLPLLRASPTVAEYASLAYLVVPLGLSLIAALGLHRIFERVWTWMQLAVDLVKLHIALFVGLTVIIFVTQTIINRTIIFAFLFFNFSLLLAERTALGLWRRLQHNSGQGRIRMLLIGDSSPELSSFTSEVQHQALPPYIVGRLGAPSVSQDGDIFRIGELKDLERVLHEDAIDQVLFFPPFNSPEGLESSLHQCEMLGIPANFAILHSRRKAPAQIVSFYDMPFLAFENAPKVPYAVALKHALDVVAAALLLLILSPVFILTALAIFVTMGRPVIFIQERAGLFGRKFRMRKFRTMVAGAEQQRSALESVNEMDGPVFKVANDPRVTPLGRLLRRTSIDELPQLFDVLLGTMSLVGPRPLPIEEQQAIRGWHRRRLSMKPGITGLWQVSGRSDLGFEDWMQLDLTYVDQWSFFLDLEILAKTVPAVLFTRGAR